MIQLRIFQLDHPHCSMFFKQNWSYCIYIYIHQILLTKYHFSGLKYLDDPKETYQNCKHSNQHLPPRSLIFKQKPEKLPNPNKKTLIFQPLPICSGEKFPWPHGDTFRFACFRGPLAANSSRPLLPADFLGEEIWGMCFQRIQRMMNIRYVYMHLCMSYVFKICIHIYVYRYLYIYIHHIKTHMVYIMFHMWISTWGLSSLVNSSLMTAMNLVNKQPVHVVTPKTTTVTTVINLPLLTIDTHHLCIYIYISKYT